jgi:predicted permease
MIGLIVDAVFPIAWVLGSGFLLKRYAPLDRALWRGLEWLAYWVLMPSLLISVIVSAPQITVPWTALLISLYGTLIGLSLLLIAGWRLQWFGASYARFTSVYQGVIRFNTFIALAVIAGLDKALLPHVGIAAAAIIVVINVACVSVMTAGESDRRIQSIVRELIRNPLILACGIGGGLRVIGMPSSFPISGLTLVGQAALPIGVLCLGAGLRWEAIRTGIGLNASALVLIFLIKPALYLSLAVWLQLDPQWLLVGLLLMSVSTAPSSFILAKQLGGDADLMAGIVATQTLFSMMSLPALLWLVDQIGLIALA